MTSAKIYQRLRVKTYVTNNQKSRTSVIECLAGFIQLFFSETDRCRPTFIHVTVAENKAGQYIPAATSHANCLLGAVVNALPGLSAI